ncbi:MAG: Gfo/Idh/MocA family oxidoreductase [Bacteroidota bacterium]
MNQLKVGLVGLGRLGKRYAEILHHQTPSAQLATVCSINPEELHVAKQQWGISSGYTDLKECLKQEQVDAVFIVSSTDQHADHIIQGLEAGCHVFCEKPLSINIQECERVEAIAAKYPTQLAVIGFNRRHDPSYAYAKQKIEEGLIGRPFQVHSQTVDKDTVAEFQIQYVKNSGGIFHDFNVHDIDLARWYLGSEIQTVFAVGGAYKYPAFAEQGDADNVLTTCVFENGTIATIRASRIAMHGHDTYTEITGTEGSLRIGRPAQLNRVEIYDKDGVRKECVESFYDRFAEAFHIQIQDFIRCVQEGGTPASSLHDATEATRAAEAFTHSFEQKQLVHITR